MDSGWLPAGKGDPAMLINWPVFGMIANPLTLPPWLVVYTNDSDGSTTMELGPNPARKGEPFSSFKEPVEESMLKAETLLPPLSAVYAYLPVGLTAIAIAFPLPTAYPACLSRPLPASTV